MITNPTQTYTACSYAETKRNFPDFNSVQPRKSAELKIYYKLPLTT